jgi:two-component system, chemotaxis family, protein-glutamate methylesterase/glutaminase
MIVIGGSLGGSFAVGRILAGLPPDFAEPIAVVLHRHKESEGIIVPILQRECRLTVSEAEDKEPILPGHVYLCPADYHLMVDDGCFCLSTDDLVSFARPSIDVLFESAAEWHGPSATAIVLSGSGADGSAGARRITERGGRVLVQDPRTAEGRWMPEAAIAASPHCRVLSLELIAPELLRTSGSRPRRF